MKRSTTDKFIPNKMARTMPREIPTSQAPSEDTCSPDPRQLRHRRYSDRTVEETDDELDDSDDHDQHTELDGDDAPVVQPDDQSHTMQDAAPPPRDPQPQQLPRRSLGDSRGSTPDTDDTEESFRGKTIRLPLSRRYKDFAEGGARPRRILYSPYVTYNYMTTVDMITLEEMEEENGLLNHDRYQWRFIIVPLLASIPVPVLTAALDGTLVRKDMDGVLDDKHQVIHETYADGSPWMTQMSVNFAPGIYLRFLTDDLGNSPSPKALLNVVHHLRNYANGSDHETAVSIDNALRVELKQTATVAGIAAGGHRYFQGSQKRVEILLTWCAAITNLCNDVALPHHDEPLPHGITYCGYASKVLKRMEQHESGTSTSWLAVLVEATFHVTNFRRRYMLHLYPVAYLADVKEAKLAKRAITRCSYSDYKYGGLSVAAPGLVSSAVRPERSSSDNDKDWEALRQWRLENTPYDTNMQIEAKCIDVDTYVPLKSPAELEAERERALAAIEEKNQRTLVEAVALWRKFQEDEKNSGSTYEGELAEALAETDAMMNNLGL